MDQHDDSTPPNEGVTFTRRTDGPGKARVALIGGAAIALAVGAVATSMAASPSATPSTPAIGGGIGLLAPIALTGDPEIIGGFELGRVGDHIGFHEITIQSIDGSSVSLATED